VFAFFFFQCLEIIWGWSSPPSVNNNNYPFCRFKAKRRQSVTPLYVHSSSPQRQQRRRSLENQKQPQYRRSDDFLEATTVLQSTRFERDLVKWLSLRDKMRLLPTEHTQYLRELSNCKYYEAMLVFLEHHSDHSLVCYTLVLSALAKSKRHSLQTAWKLLDDMENHDLVPNKYTFTALLKHATSGNQAMEMLEQLQKRYPSIQRSKEVYNAAVHACTRDGDWETALTLFQQLKSSGMQPNQATYASLIFACGQGSQVRIALRLLDEMTVVPNPVVWGAALTATAKAGMVEQALHLLRNMVMGYGQIPTSRHIGAYLAALAKAGKDETALSILHKLRRQEEGIELTEGFVVPSVPLDLVMINTALQACAKRGNYSEAKRLLQELKDGVYTVTAGRSTIPLHPDEVTYNTVLSACYNGTEAKALIREMRLTKRHRYHQVPPTTKSYTLAIKACRDDFDSARYLLDNSIHDGIDPPNVFMYSAAIWTAERCGLPNEAMALLEEMKIKGVAPNAVSYGGVLSALSKAGRPLDAVEMFLELKDNGIRTDESVFTRLMEAIQNRKDSRLNVLDLLETIMSRMEASDFSVKTAGPILEAVILEYGMNDRFDDALWVFEMIYGPTNGPCLRAILSACALSYRWQEAISILHTSDIVDCAVGPALVDTRAIGFAILACSKSGEWQEGLNLLHLYGQPQPFGVNSTATVPRSAINSLIASCGRGGRADQALCLLNEMKSKYDIEPNEISYRSATIACNQAEHERRRRRERDNDPIDESMLQWWECSLSLLRRMQDEGLRPDAQTYSSVISACEAAGQWQRALGVLRGMMAESEEELNLFCFNAAISACEKGGAWVEALELYFQMLEKGGNVSPNFVSLSGLLIALDKAGQKDLAQTLYDDGVRAKIVRPWTRTRDPRSGELIRAVDLHNFSEAMAKTAMRSVLESLLQGKPVHDVTTELVIIVGKGKGSEYDPVLLPAVQKLLDEDYEVPCSMDPLNAGRLIVTSEALQSFVARRSWH
jgi:pentatricopeptide repeat domain-containing protein 1